MSAAERAAPGAAARPESSSSARTTVSADLTAQNGDSVQPVSAKPHEADGGGASRGRDVERGARSKEAPTGTCFEVTFEESDPMNPRNRYGSARKWIMVLVVSSTSLCVTCTSSLYTQTYGQIQPEFYTSEIIATLGLSLFVAGLGLGPMVLAPLSEVRWLHCLSFPQFLFISTAPELFVCSSFHSLCWPSVGRHKERDAMIPA